MTHVAWLQFAVFMAALFVLARPLGQYMARVYQGQPVFLDPLARPLEKSIYRLSGIDPGRESDWKGYARDFLVFQAVGLLVLLTILLLQGVLPLNPARRGGLSWHLAFNTAVSFVTNTNWQSYAGEATMSHLRQMLGLTVQNFVSAATGMAVLVALIRGFARRSSRPDRQLLGRYGPVNDPRAAAAVDRPDPGAGLAGRGADALRIGHGATGGSGGRRFGPGRGPADHPAGSGGLAGRRQAARHQRRRLLQRQLRRIPSRIPLRSPTCSRRWPSC